MVVSNIFYFHPYLGKISNLTNIFQLSWNHQPLICWYFPGVVRRCYSYSDLILEPPCPRSGPKRRAFFSKKLMAFQFQVQRSGALEPKKHLFSPNDCDSTWKKYVIPNLYQKTCDSKPLHKKGVVFTKHPSIFFSTDEFQLPRGCLLPAGPTG